LKAKREVDIKGGKWERRLKVEVEVEYDFVKRMRIVTLK
jgi:hypothetical protein